MVVQGGRVSSPQIRDLKDVVKRKKAAMGVFISLEESTQDMRDEEARAVSTPTSPGPLARPVPTLGPHGLAPDLHLIFRSQPPPPSAV